jgi:hypothetical protein
VQLYHRSGGKHPPKCKFCGLADEYTSHICRCRDPGRDKMFCILLKELCSWLIETLGKHAIAATIKTYLLSQGDVLMADCVHRSFGQEVSFPSLSVISHTKKL